MSHVTRHSGKLVRSGSFTEEERCMMLGGSCLQVQRCDDDGDDDDDDDDDDDNDDDDDDNGDGGGGGGCGGFGDAGGNSLQWLNLPQALYPKVRNSIRS